MKCDACGKESDFEAAFIKQHRSLHRTDLNLCPACWLCRQRASIGWHQLAILAGGAIGYVLLWLDPSSAPGWILTRFFLVNVFLILAIIPHELGHAIAGVLVGWRVFAVVIGAGKQYLKFRLFGIIFVFNWLPIGGVTRLAPTSVEWFRMKRFVTVLAGPLANAVIAVLILFVCWDSVRGLGFWGLPHLPRLCFVANLWTIVLNLLPHKSKLFGSSDGRQLVKTLSDTRVNAERLLALRFALESAMRRDEYKDPDGALKWCNEGLALFPNDFYLLNLSGGLCLDARDYNRARKVFLQVLSNEKKPGRKRSAILNNIAYADALAGDPSLLPEADAYSEEAYASLPWVPSIIGTRGTVLVEMRKFEQGIKLLKESIKKHHIPRNKALNVCYLAIAYARLGDGGQAVDYLNLARQLDPRCYLLERTAAEMQKPQ